MEKKRGEGGSAKAGRIWPQEIDEEKNIFSQVFNQLEGPKQHEVVVRASKAFVLAILHPSQVEELSEEGKF